MIPAMDHIDEHLKTAALNADYPMPIKAALTIGKKTLNQYYNKTDQSEIFRITMGKYFLIYNDWKLIYSQCYILNISSTISRRPDGRKSGQQKRRTEFKWSYKYRDNLDEGCGPKDETLTSKVCKFIITDLGQN